MDVACRLAASAARASSRDGDRGAARAAARRLPAGRGAGGERAARRGAGDRRARTGSASIVRIVRARNAGRAIVDEATRRGSEIIVMGGPRRVRLAAGQRAIFGDTVDFVLKHAPVPRDGRRVEGARRSERRSYRRSALAVRAPSIDRARLRDPRLARRGRGRRHGRLHAIGALFVALGIGAGSTCCGSGDGA